MFRFSRSKRCAAPFLDSMSPRSMVAVLDSYIIGQQECKKAVAVSLRNRWRRRQLTDEGLRGDVVPKNMLLIGPTGVGKTEISRRMAKLTDAPFVKVEATKYTEVGFKGKDVESIIEDLFANAKSKSRRRLEVGRDEEATRMAEDVIFSALTRKQSFGDLKLDEFRKQYETVLKDEMVTIDIAVRTAPQSPQQQQAKTLDALFGSLNEKPKIQRVTKRVAEAFILAKQGSLDKLIDDTQVQKMAKDLAEEDGIVFIDEIDKVVSEPNSDSADVSSLGVQQDLLPLIEGSMVTLKDGTQISTDNVLFVCAGAFHTAKPSDMIAELQGRLPVKVELQPLCEDDFRRILVEPKFNLLKQQQALLGTEKIDLNFTEDGISALAKLTRDVNTNAQNIGARRLHTILERVLDEYSFNCDKYENQRVVIDSAKVFEATNDLRQNLDLAKYLL